MLRIEYYYCCLGAFASRHRLSNVEAYRYLKTFKGLDFIDKLYEVEHTVFATEKAINKLVLKDE